jgi:hypothetical protein
MTAPWKVSSICIKLMICWSSSNTLQFVMLSGIDGMNNNSIENALRERPSMDNILEATLANKSTSELLNLEMEFMLNDENLCIKIHTSVWYLFRCGDKKCMSFLTYLSTISESPNTIKFFTSISNAFLSPCRSYSYSVVLLVYLNSN